MTGARTFIALLLVAAAWTAVGRVEAGEQPATAAPRPSPAEVRLVTVPLVLDHNRMYVAVEFSRPDGTVRGARAWVDTGNPDLILAEPLARDLGLAIPPEVERGAPHSVASTSPAPPMRLSGLRLDVEGITTRIHAGTNVRPGVVAEASLPASALRRLHVVLDYPQHQITVARPGVIEPRGIAIPCHVNTTTGLFQIAATIDGKSVELGVDNGSAGTWISETLVREWQNRHPGWPHATGAVGSTNFFGFDFEASGTLMRLPELGLGPLDVANVALLGLPQELFDWYSKKSAGKVAGFIGANVLKGFRVEVDYPNRMTYWEVGGPTEQHDLDIVGLTVRPEPDGGFTVAGVATRDGVRTVTGIEPGDRLIRVDALEVTGTPMGTVVDALRGAPGVVHTLVAERDGRHITVEAKVVCFP